MAILSAGQSVQINIGEDSGIWANCTGIGAASFEFNKPAQIPLTSEYKRIGFYGIPVTVTLSCTSGQIEYLNSQPLYSQLKAIQGGDQDNSSPLDIKLNVNGLQSGGVPFEAITLKGAPNKNPADNDYGSVSDAINGINFVPLGNRFRTPTGAATSGAGSVFGFGRYVHKSPSSPTSKMVMAFAAWFTNDTGEQVLGDDYLIEGCGVWVDGVFYRAKFNGSDSAVIPNGTTVYAEVKFSNPIPANSTILIDTADSTVISGRKRALMGARVVRQSGDLVVLGSSSYASYLGSAPPVMTLTSSNLQAPSPIFVFCQTNYSGTSTFLVTGDSIAYGIGESDMASTPIPSAGYISRCLGAIGGSSVNLGVSGNKPSTAASEAFYQRRFEILDYIKQLTGRYPFRFVIDEHIVNDMGGSVTLATLKGYKQAMISMLKSKFSLPVLSTTPTPRTSAIVSGDYSGDASQSIGAGNGINDSRWTYQNDIVGDYASYGLFGVLDISSGCQSPTAKDKWITPDGYAGALSSAASAGATSILLARSGLATQPKVGDYLVIGAGTATAETVIVKSCAISSSTVYSISFVNQSGSFTLINSYSSGAVVKSSGTSDGVHPAPASHYLMSLSMESELKRVGVI